MYNRDELREKAVRVRDKKGAIGPDIDLNKFDEAPVPHSYLADEDLCAIPADEQKNDPDPSDDRIQKAPLGVKLVAKLTVHRGLYKQGGILPP